MNSLGLLQDCFFKELFTFETLNPNLAERFIPECNMLRHIYSQAGKFSPGWSESISSWGWRCRHCSCHISPSVCVSYSGEHAAVRILAEGTSKPGKKKERVRARTSGWLTFQIEIFSSIKATERKWSELRKISRCMIQPSLLEMKHPWFWRWESCRTLFILYLSISDLYCDLWHAMWSIWRESLIVSVNQAVHANKVAVWPEM